MNSPLRGEIWLVQLDPVRGHEQSKTRPCLVISNNEFNKSLAKLIIIVPLTSQSKTFSLHIKIPHHESELKVESFIMPEHVRSVSTQRFIEPIGRASYNILLEVEKKIKLLLDFV